MQIYDVTNSQGSSVNQKIVCQVFYDFFCFHTSNNLPLQEIPQKKKCKRVNEVTSWSVQGPLKVEKLSASENGPMTKENRVW